MNIWKYTIVQIWKYKNHILKYKNIHVEKYKLEDCKRVCKESKYIYINYKVTSNRNFSKETNKRNKEKITNI